MTARSLGLALVLLGVCAGGEAQSGTAEARFREANEQARAGDYPKALARYAEIASSGAGTAALYWNWSQVAAARGAPGEALWAALRVRELAPWDRAALRRIDALRGSLNLDPAELSPEPLAGLGRWSRRLHVSLVAAALLLLSVLGHALARWAGPERSWAGRVAWSAGLLGVALALTLALSSTARPTAVVLRRGAPLLDAASPSAEVSGTLREGEVVPVFDRSGAWRRVQDSSGARGWAHADDVRPIEDAQW